MNVPHPGESALLWIGLVVEAALIELDAGGRQPALRAAIAGFLPRRLLTAGKLTPSHRNGPRRHIGAAHGPFP